eukprot:2437349-Rhodomonas_salina.3
MYPIATVKYQISVAIQNLYFISPIGKEIQYFSSSTSTILPVLWNLLFPAPLLPPSRQLQNLRSLRLSLSAFGAAYRCVKAQCCPERPPLWCRTWHGAA